MGRVKKLAVDAANAQWEIKHSQILAAAQEIGSTAIATIEANSEKVAKLKAAYKADIARLRKQEGARAQKAEAELKRRKKKDRAQKAKRRKASKRKAKAKREANAAKRAAEREAKRKRFVTMKADHKAELVRLRKIRQDMEKGRKGRKAAERAC